METNFLFLYARKLDDISYSVIYILTFGRCWSSWSSGHFWVNVKHSLLFTWSVAISYFTVFVGFWNISCHHKRNLNTEPMLCHLPQTQWVFLMQPGNQWYWPPGCVHACQSHLFSRPNLYSLPSPHPDRSQSRGSHPFQLCSDCPPEPSFPDGSSPHTHQAQVPFYSCSLRQRITDLKT